MSPLHPKVKVPAAAGALATLVIFVSAMLGYPLPPEVAAAVVTLLMFAAGYLTPPE